MEMFKPAVKVPVGMQTLDFWPMSYTDPENPPKYDGRVHLGAAVKGYLTITTDPATIAGDDTTQLYAEVFSGAQLDTETTMNDLKLNALLFGHEIPDENAELSRSVDMPQYGGISFIEPILVKDRGVVYRATCLFKCVAMSSSEKQEADTRKPGDFNPKMNAVSFKVFENEKKVWRIRQEFGYADEAEAFILNTFGAAAEG